MIMSCEGSATGRPSEGFRMLFEESIRMRASARASDAQVLETMKTVYEASGYVLDPHSAVGVAAAQQPERGGPSPL